LTGRVITYGELVDQVRRVAAGLGGPDKVRPTRARIGKADGVAICAPNVPEFAVVFHAVARIGGILTTINPAYTADEIAFQLRDAGAKLLITTAGLADRAPEAVKLASASIEIFTIDEAPGLPSLASIAIDGEPPHVVINPSTDVVVLPYSSGTTGLPKGV